MTGCICPKDVSGRNDIRHRRHIARRSSQRHIAWENFAWCASHALETPSLTPHERHKPYLRCMCTTARHNVNELPSSGKASISSSLHHREPYFHPRGNDLSSSFLYSMGTGGHQDRVSCQFPPASCPATGNCEQFEKFSLSHLPFSYCQQACSPDREAAHLMPLVLLTQQLKTEAVPLRNNVLSWYLIFFEAYIYPTRPGRQAKFLKGGARVR